MRTYFYHGLDIGENLGPNARRHEGRAVVIGGKQPAKLQPYLYTQIAGSHPHLVEPFFAGQFLEVLHAKYMMDCPVGVATAAKAMRDYDAALDALAEAHANVIRKEAELAEAAKGIVTTRGNCHVVIRGVSCHVSYHHLTGKIFWVPTRGGRPCKEKR